jgi:hypothetical protein
LSGGKLRRTIMEPINEAKIRMYVLMEDTLIGIVIFIAILCVTYWASQI